MIVFKVIFIVLDSLLILGGIGLAIICFYGAYNENVFHIEESQEWSLIVLKVIGAFGILIAVTGIAGLVAVSVDSSVLKHVYNGVLTAIAVFLLVFGVIAIIVGLVTKIALDGILRDKMSKYDPKDPYALRVDAIQSSLKCCGLSGEPVYKNPNDLPWSCCEQSVGRVEKHFRTLAPNMDPSIFGQLKPPCRTKDAFKKKCDQVYSPPCVLLKSVGIALVVFGLLLIVLSLTLYLS